MRPCDLATPRPNVLATVRSRDLAATWRHRDLLTSRPRDLPTPRHHVLATPRPRNLPTYQPNLHRIGRNPSSDCRQCSDINWPAGRCTVCREEADIPRHVLLRCPALMERRLRWFVTICPDPPEVRGDEEVAALAAAMRSLQTRSATPR